MQPQHKSKQPHRVAVPPILVMPLAASAQVVWRMGSSKLKRINWDKFFQC